MGKSKKRTLSETATEETIEVTTENNEDEAENTTKEEITEEVPVKKPKLFMAKEFRQQIKSDSKILAMKSFHTLCTSSENSQEIIHDYIKTGGSCLELLQLLEGETNIPQVQILESVYQILLRIIAKYPQHQTNAFEACRYLLNTHINMVNKMLGLASTGKERRIMLKLLTAIVTFSASLAKDVLIHVKFHSANLEVLTKHTGEVDSVRNAFIHFLISFLVDGHYPTISMLLEKQGLLSSIIRGLQYDLADSVCLIMLTLKKHILENPLVSKTAKMKTFSTPVVRDIVNLYNWKGPKGYDPRKNTHRLNVEVDEYDKSRVSEAVHDFLLILCTSVKYGVIFKDKMLGTGKKHQNALMFTVLESLDRPWEHSYACELVTKICAACPDLVKTMWANMKAFLEPRASVKWLNAVKFAKTLLKEIQPGCVEYCWKEYNPQQFAQMIQFLVAPTPILKTILPEPNENITPETNHITLSLIQDMLQSIETYLEAAKANFSPEYNNTLKRIIQQHISTNLPNGLKIINAWNEVPSEVSTGFKPYDALDNLDIVLNILDSYDKICPQMLDNLLTNFSITTLLNEIDNDSLQIKVVKLFLTFEPSIFNPGHELFDFVLPLLLRNYYNSRDLIGLETLRIILKNTGIFEGCDSEINIWIDSIFELKHFDDSVGDFVITIVKKASKNLLNYLGEIVELKSNCDVAMVDNVAEIVEGLMERDVVVVKNTIKHQYFSPLILAALDMLVETKGVKMYFNHVLLSLFHLQTDYHILANLLIKYEPVIQANTWNYIAGWISNDVTPLIKSKGKLDLLPKLSRAILESNIDLIKETNLDSYSDLRLNLLQTLIFYLTNLKQHEHLNVCLELVKLSNDYVTVLSNPVLLQRFNPLNKNFETNFIISYVQNMKISNDYLNPYRNKLFNTVMKLLKKAKLKTNDGLVDVVELFGLDHKECEAILNQFATLSIEGLNNDALTEFYNILTYSLQKFSELKSYNPLEATIFEKLCKLQSNLNKTSLITSKLTTSTINYLNHYPHNYKNIPVELFITTIQKDYCKEASILATNILKNRPDFLQQFESNLETIATKKGLFLPLLECIYKLQPIPELLQKCYTSFETSIQKALQKPQKAGQHFENNQAISKLIGSHIQPKQYLEKIQKYESTEPFLAEILVSIYINYIEQNEIEEKHINSSILTLVHLIVNFYKRKTKSEEDWNKLKQISESFQKLLNKLTTTFQYESVRNNETFKLFCKFALKFGLTNSASSLGLLSRFVEIIQFTDEEANDLMEMVVSHSEFMNVVLNNDSEFKKEVLGLILGLCTRWKGVMKRDHVPVLLGAYGATLEQSDQVILQLLKLYESQPAQTNFYDFKPFLWGTAARNHYSLRSDIQKSIWRQPKTGNVLDILHEPWVMNTIKHYPLNISFQSKTIDTNEIPYPIYDLRFLLPLFSQLLAPENSIQTYKFSRSGALSLTIIALSCNNEEIRKAACHVLARYYYHLESKGNGKDNLLWLRFVEAICKGTAILNNFKLNNFSAILLSRMALILTKPKDLMYLPLSFYLGARSAPDLSSIPELYTFLRSSDVNYKEHRLFIFEILRDGLRQDSDFSISLKSMAYKLIMETYTSSISDYESKQLILQVLKNACVYGTQTLCNYHGLLSWLHGIILNTKEVPIMGKIIEILYNIIKSKHADLVMLKVVFAAILDKVFDMKLKTDVVLCLLKCLVALQEGDVGLINDSRMRRIVKFVNNDLCEYMLDFNCVIDVEGEKDVDYYVKLLTCKFISDK